MRCRTPVVALFFIAVLMVLLSACERRPHVLRAMEHAREQAKINVANFERNRERRLAMQQLQRQAKVDKTFEVVEEEEQYVSP